MIEFTFEQVHLLFFINPAVIIDLAVFVTLLAGKGSVKILIIIKVHSLVPSGEKIFIKSVRRNMVFIVGVPLHVS